MPSLSSSDCPWLPMPQTVFRLKRLYQADSVHAQISLEERLAKRARVGTAAKRRHLA